MNGLADVKEEAGVWSFEASNEATTLAIAAAQAAWLEPGDFVALTGDLGAGKTAFARGLIRTLVDAPDLEAPSPTYTLMQIYEAPRGPLSMPISTGCEARPSLPIWAGMRRSRARSRSSSGRRRSLRRCPSTGLRSISASMRGAVPIFAW
jgi:hypothetical protein